MEHNEEEKDTNPKDIHLHETSLKKIKPKLRISFEDQAPKEEDDLKKADSEDEHTHLKGSAPSQEHSPEPEKKPKEKKLTHMLSMKFLLQQEEHSPSNTAEERRIREDALRKQNWKRWGPYLSERQWGTVREDYSADGNTWQSLTHDQSRSKAYRWGEDGIMGITDRECRLCFALCLWNGKERLYGLTGPEGNHGEDVKEEYFYLESTPTHSYMKGLYKYPISEFPYKKICEENARRGKGDPEYELMDTGVFDNGNYFDVFVEYAKGGENDILIKITVGNRSANDAVLHLMPTIWFRNTWAWGRKGEGYWPEPNISKYSTGEGIFCEHSSLGNFRLEVETMGNYHHKPEIAKHLVKKPEWLFTNNETNFPKLYGTPNRSSYVKDAFHDYIIHNQNVVNPSHYGTKACSHNVINVPAKKEVVLKLRLFAEKEVEFDDPFVHFEKVFSDRIKEKNLFYEAKIPHTLSSEERKVMVQSLAGLLWSKQFFYYNVKEWLEGDPNYPKPPPSRWKGRNHDWTHLNNRDVISMPDKWEYPWYAVWDLAFHCVAFSIIDVEFAKNQMLLILREWYMHPNGALPAYEFNFSDVNPPVHAWACWRIYKSSGPEGKRDLVFLGRAFQKLLLNFTWWVNRKDVSGNHIFSGGFLGLDNIGVFDRSRPLPGGGYLEQADGTAWMGFYCIYMLKMALELAHHDLVYEDVASKFFEHFGEYLKEKVNNSVRIADAMNAVGGSGLWNEESGFYYDQLKTSEENIPLQIRSLVGLVPFFGNLNNVLLLTREAVGNLDTHLMQNLEGFKRRTEWFVQNRKDLAKQISLYELRNVNHEEEDSVYSSDVVAIYHLAIPNEEKSKKLLKYVLDPNEFLSDYGIRSLSRYHKDHPYRHSVGHEKYEVEYVPGESNSSLFGGNSNWRGPIWFPMNYLLIESLTRFYNFYGHSLEVEYPSGSGKKVALNKVAYDLMNRMVNLFLPDEKGRRPVHGDSKLYSEDPHWKDLILFYEYFHGDTGKGLGASHQTGWTSLVACCLDDIGRARMKKKMAPFAKRLHPHNHGVRWSHETFPEQHEKK